jgi:hypothetical protein
MHAFLQDLRHGARMYARQPGLWTLAVVALALGVGVNSTVFTMVRSLITRPLSILDPDRTVVLLPHNPRQARERERAFPAEFAEWRAQSRSFERLVAFDTSSRSLTGIGEPESVEAAEVFEGFLELLRARWARVRRTLLARSRARPCAWWRARSWASDWPTPRAACWAPARRAASAEPAKILRGE